MRKMPKQHLMQKDVAGSTRSASNSPLAPVDIAILAYPTVFPSAVFGAVEAFEIANAVADNFKSTTPIRRFKPRIIAPKAGWLPLSTNVSVRTTTLGRSTPNVLFVPPSFQPNVRALFDGVSHLDAEHQLIRSAHAGGTLIATQCVGVLLTAAAGILNERRATTSWWLGQGMRKRYPRVHLALDRMLVEDGGVLTAGPATAQFDLYVRIIQRYMGDALASFCAQLWATEPGREFQGVYSRNSETDQVTDAVVVKAIEYANRNLGKELSLTNLADAAATSSRTLIRRFHASVGDSPLGYLQRMRVDRAKHLLAASSLSLERIVERTGYTDVSSFRRLFRSLTGVTPADYRARFRLKAQVSR
jgi:transcriptional regulator GlxA family with amidase domain